MMSSAVKLLMLMALTARSGGSQEDFDELQTDYTGIVADEV